MRTDGRIEDEANRRFPQILRNRLKYQCQTLDSVRQNFLTQRKSQRILSLQTPRRHPYKTRH